MTAHHGASRRREQEASKPLIEKLFAKLEHWLRKAARRTPEAVCEAIGHILNTVKATECHNYFNDAGYRRT